MEEKNLLASVALFSELYNSDTYNSIFDILAEFIKSGLILQQKFSFNSLEVKTLLETEYGFRIPETVIRTTLNNKLKDCVSKVDGIYYLDQSSIPNTADFLKDFSVINQTQNTIIKDIEVYIEKKKKVVLTEAMKADIFQTFNQILLDNGYSDNYSDLISAYIVLKEKDENFQTSLNMIREGLIMYQGIIYTPNINELGKWNGDLVIYLNTDELFSALGYDGVLFQEIFQDFHKLVTEINLTTSLGKPRKIQLRYLEETQNEIDSIFYIAEAIKKGNKRLDPRKGSAMKVIVDRCESPSDARAQKIKFEFELKNLGITLQEFNHNWENVSKYNVEDQSVLEELRKKSTEKGRSFDENLCLQYFKVFTKINFFRKGESNKSLEKVGHIFITENGFAKYLAHNNAVKFSDTDLPFAKDLDYITTKFWFKLKKGFSDKQTLPKSFSVVNKAKLILSAHVRASVGEEYNKLIHEVETGTLSTEEARQRSYEFREKPTKPEDITTENVESTIDFLNDDSYYDNISRERQKAGELLEERASKIEELQQELDSRKKAEATKEFEKRQAEREYEMMITVEEKIQAERETNRSDLIYFLLTLFPEVIIIIIGFSLKGYKPISDYVDNSGNWQWVIWMVLALVIAISIYFRSHIYDKTKIKNGYAWFKICFGFKLKSYITERKESLIYSELEKIKEENKN